MTTDTDWTIGEFEQGGSHGLAALFVRAGSLQFVRMFGVGWGMRWGR